MKKIVRLSAALLLGACVYGSPVNQEKFYSNADITKVEWTKIDGYGSSCQTNWFFGLLPFGDNSVTSAVEQAEISKISYIDTDTVLYLPLLMTRECTNVWGELTADARAALAYRNLEEEEEDEEEAAEASASDYVKPVAKVTATPAATPAASAAKKN